MEPAVFVLVLMVLSLMWMLWYLLWARRQPDISPHTDHHAGGATVTGVLILFAACSLLLCVFMMGYNIVLSSCLSTSKLLLPFFETPFLFMQTYLLWAHSKDCIHKHTILTRCGLMLILSTDVLLWLRAVTEDTIHMEIEMEKQITNDINNTDWDNDTLCRCAAQPVCVVLRKGYEVLYPFNMEFCLLAGSMLYVMWKNVSRHTAGAHQAHNITLNVMRRGGILLGPVLGLLVLLTGGTVFVLYQMWVGQQARRDTAFLLFYSFHLGLIPIMVLSSLSAAIIQRTQMTADGHSDDVKHELAHMKNPTRSLDVVLLLGAALGQLSLSYLSLVAGLSLGPNGIMGELDLSFSILSLLELLVQNVFIIQGLQTHGHAHAKRLKNNSNRKKTARGQREENIIYKQGERVPDPIGSDAIFGEGNDSPGQQKDCDHHNWSRRIIKEICAFLILSNIMLWVIPAFGAHPQFENGVGKQFFGFVAWFVLMNLGQPLIVFYRMHSVGVLMEILISA
ncbi:proton channel OTOP3-like isoform X2 [Triplophysa rosa]|nr:proton channel OTOP3-like isoform X2 [Triplophysa rosa]